MTPDEPAELSCGRSGRCLSTTKSFRGDLGGLTGADKLCQAEYPGSHFFRRDCDALRDLTHAFGYGELLLGPCWNCNGWTSADSGDYLPDKVDCQSGYATVGGMLPYSACQDLEHFGSCWRICEAGDKPLVCCLP